MTGKRGRKAFPLLLVDEEPMQWHLATSRYDHCPQCGGGVGYLGPRQRCCMGVCNDGFTRRLQADPGVWLHNLGFSPEECDELLRQRGSGPREIRWVRPGFLGRSVLCDLAGELPTTKRRVQP